MAELANSLVSKFELSDEEGGVSLEQSMETDSTPTLHDTTMTSSSTTTGMGNQASAAQQQQQPSVPTVVTTSPHEKTPATCTSPVSQQVRTSNSTRLRSVFCTIL
jgi:hypothetical protein